MRDGKGKMRLLLGGLTVAMTVAANSATVLAAPQQMPDGTVFDAEYYAQSNPDVVAALGNGAEMMWAHYSLFGKNEGRLPVAPETTAADGFDAAYYAAKYPDVAAAFGNDPAMLKYHYDACGKREGRFANAAQERAAQTAVQNPVAQQSQVSPAYSLFQAINAERQAEGYNALAWSATLEYPVSIRLNEIRECFDHTRPNKTDFRTVLENENIACRESQELIARGDSASDVIELWMSSASTKTILLNRDLSKAAIACVKDGSTTYWEMLIVKPK